ncbi:MAG: homoserine kinase [Clostridium sp.]|nr:homoserine kinase [Clostridium sp.]
MFKIKVPASTANLGAGFDCFGMALNLYNEFEFEKSNYPTVFLEDGKKSSIPIEDNLIFFSMKKAFELYNFKFTGFTINSSKSNVPLSRGLGSSATCIAAGIHAANYYMNGIMNQDEIVKLAAQIEGHPDNVVPALLGGFNISIMENGEVKHSRVEVPNDILFAAIIPNFKMDTASSRKVLPDKYTREDCVFNISRASMLVSSFYAHDYKNLRFCFEDKLHQPYRKNGIRDIDLIFKKAQDLNSYGEFISGSGSTLMIVIDKNNNIFYEEMNCFLKSLTDKWKVEILSPDLKGIEII